MRESDQNKTTRAVFILNTRLGVGMGAARIRGYDAARIVGGTVAPCDASVASIPADMFVHVKYPCEHARPVQAFHVFDRIDNSKPMPHRQRKALCPCRGLTRRSLRTKRSCVDAAIARAQGSPTTQTLNVGCTGT